MAKAIELEFASLAAAQDYAYNVRKDAPRHNVKYHADIRTRGGRDASWYGIEGGYQAVEATIRHGWPEGVQRMEDALSGFEAPPQPTSVRRRMSRADMGDAVDMGRIWRGELATAWSRCAPRDSRAIRRITIACPIWDNCHVDAKRLFWRGAAALTLADLLTAVGYAVEIVATAYSKHAYENGADFSCRVTVKAFTEPLDKQSLASTVCLSGFFRHVLFLACINQATPVTWGLGYGTPSAPREGEIADIAECMSAETAHAWLTAKLAQIVEGETV